MLIKGTMSVELDWQQEAKVIVDVMKRDYASLAKDVDDLLKKDAQGKLEDYEREDLENNIEFMRSMDSVIQFYSSQEAYTSWSNAWVVYTSLYRKEKE